VGGLACLQHVTIRTLLWQTNNAPWNYAHFLNYATERLLMKRAGGGYLFIHGLLRQNLATERERIKPKPSWQSYSQRIILGVGIGMICLISILLPTAINSWKVTTETAKNFYPRLHEGDRLLTDRFFYRIRGLNKGDIVIFELTPEIPYSPRGRNKIKGLVCDVVNINRVKDIPIYKKKYSISFRTDGKSNNYSTQVPLYKIEERAVLRIWPKPGFI
jgi:hypothetical protein